MNTESMSEVELRAVLLGSNSDAQSKESALNELIKRAQSDGMRLAYLNSIGAE